MILRNQITGLLLLFTFFLFGFGLPKSIHKKVQKEVMNVFKVSTFSMESVSVSESVNAQLPSKITTNNLFKLMDGANLLGYAFTDKASSKTAQYDYLVLFDKDLKVIHSKVLIYREEYGGEIGSKRWLKQFLGKTGSDRVDIKTNIDAISGATISVRSMTKSMDNLLQTIGILQENNQL